MRPLTDEEAALPQPPPGYFCKYGLTFVDLLPEDVEFLRQWRNHPEITQWMIHRDEITAEQQWAWYQRLDPAKESFCIVRTATERIGLCQLRHIDMATKSAEGGIILFKPEHQNGLWAHRASIAGLDWNFLHRGLELMRVTVLKHNSRAQRLVKSLGYVLRDGGGDKLLGELTRERYFDTVAKWRAVIRAESY